MRTNRWLNEARLTGLCLAAGSLTFLVAAVMPLWDSSGRSVFAMPMPDRLAFILDNQTLWAWTNALFIGSALVTLFGLAMLADLMRDTPGRLLSRLGLLAFLVGVLLWTVEVGFRVSMGAWDRAGASDRAAIDLFMRVSAWLQVLYVVDIMLVLLSLAAYGASLLVARLLPAWVGWVLLTFAALGLAMLFATGDVPPFIAYLPLLALGIRLAARPLPGATALLPGGASEASEASTSPRPA
jgi:hypothetical protein